MHACRSTLEDPTAQEWLDRYLLPLANVDLLADSFRTFKRAIQISRLTYVKTDVEGIHLDGEDEERRDEPLRVMSISAEEKETVDYFDAVIDASGVLSQSLGIGPGGAPALGESYPVWDRIGRTMLRDDQLHVIPRGAKTLLIGTEFSAARQIAKLAEVAERDPDFRCVWIARGGPQSIRSDDPREPYRVVPKDMERARGEILTKANELAKSAPWLSFVPDVAVEEIGIGEGERLDVHFVGRHAFPDGFDERQSFDLVLAFVGYRPDWSIAGECQLRLDAATDGPALLAASLLDGLADTYEGKLRFCESDALLHPEADFYVVGAKSFGRLSGFALPYGYGQIREVFAYVSERPDLDLYARAAKDEGPEWKAEAPG